MKRILAYCACGLALGSASYSLIPTKRLLTAESPHKDPEKPYGYDMFYRDVKKFKYFDRRKIKCNLKTRSQHLKDLMDQSRVFDILIIGGGSSGAGVLLEGTMRGLACALIDKEDFGCETSSRSTKLIHGGIRYLSEVFKLESGFMEKLRLVVEGLDERNYMLNSAAYMNRRLDLVIPCKNFFEVAYYFAGVCLYHFLSYVKYKFSSYKNFLPRPRFISKSEMKRQFPLLKGDYYGVRFCEGQMNDARQVLQTLLTASLESYIACMKGAALGNYVEFIDFVKDSEGKCIGAVLKDTIENTTFNVRAKVIVNATGPFVDSIRKKDNPKVESKIVPSRGVHIVLPRSLTENNVGVLIPKTKDKRVMFVLPYQGFTLAGTTDHFCENSSAPAAPKSDVEEIVNELQNYFEGDLTKDVTAAWCGIRPLIVSKNTKESRKIARTHEIEISESGLVTLLGGKWTSYRKMGQDTIDVISKVHTELEPIYRVPMTIRNRLIGSYTTKTFDGTEKNPTEFIEPYEKFLQERFKLDKDVCKQLVMSYGAHAVQVAKMGKSNKMNKRLHPELPVLKVQVLYAVRKEMAVNVRDVVFRRLGIGFLDKKLALEIIPVVAEVMGEEMGWSEREKQVEIIKATNAIDTLA